MGFATVVACRFVVRRTAAVGAFVAAEGIVGIVAIRIIGVAVRIIIGVAIKIIGVAVKIIIAVAVKIIVVTIRIIKAAAAGIIMAVEGITVFRFIIMVGPSCLNWLLN